MLTEPHCGLRAGLHAGRQQCPKQKAPPWALTLEQRTQQQELRLQGQEGKDDGNSCVWVRGLQERHPWGIVGKARGQEWREKIVLVPVSTLAFLG